MLKSTTRCVALIVALVLLTLPASATLVNFSGTTTWTQVEGPGSNSADTFVFAFTTGPDLRITQIDFVLGNGTASGTTSSLWWDLPGSPNNGGHGQYGASVTSGTVTTTDGIDQSLSLADRSGIVTFTSFIAGVTFTLTADIDKTSNCSGDCDLLNFTDFTNGGGFQFIIYLASTNPSLFIDGVNSFTFGPITGWTSGTFGGQPGASISWSGEVNLTPEPSTMFLVGGTLVLAGLWRRKKRFGRI